MYRMANAAFTVLSVHTLLVAVLQLKLAHELQSASQSHIPSPDTPASYAEWRPGEIYTDFHLLAKKPRNYRVVNTSVIMGAENIYFWLLTFVKSFKNGFYSAKLLGKQPTDLYHSQ